MKPLQLLAVCKSFSGIRAVDNITFAASPGEITGCLGPNGSGKSTTMKMIAGLIEPSAGEILFDGLTVRADLLAHKRRIGYVPEEPHLYEHLSGLEYLTMVAQLRALPPKVASNRIDGLLRLLGLHPDRHAAISAYSKGMRQKVLISAALMHDPDLLLFDEPFSGLDIGTALVLRALLDRLAANGKAILLSSHELETIERVCSRIVILHRGKVVADDRIAQLRSLRCNASLEQVFTELAIDQDVESISRQIATLISS